MISLYHFLPVCKLASVIRDGMIWHNSNNSHHVEMSGGVSVVWLTSNPDDNTITPRDVRTWQRRGELGLCVEWPQGWRKYYYGGCPHKTHHCARLAIDTSKLAVTPYLEWAKDNLSRDMRARLRTCLSLRRTRDWFICFEPIPSNHFKDVTVYGHMPRNIREMFARASATPLGVAANAAPRSRSKVDATHGACISNIRTT